jgi:hypothetical protein
MYGKRLFYESRNHNYSTKLKNDMDYDSHMKNLLQINGRDNKYLSSKYTVDNTLYKTSWRNGVSLSIYSLKLMILDYKRTIAHSIQR